MRRLISVQASNASSLVPRHEAGIAKRDVMVCPFELGQACGRFMASEGCRACAAHDGSLTAAAPAWFAPGEAAWARWDTALLDSTVVFGQTWIRLVRHRKDKPLPRARERSWAVPFWPRPRAYVIEYLEVDGCPASILRR